MALGDPYINLQELKAYTHIDDSLADTQVTSVVNAISRNIERHCGQVFNDAGSATPRIFRPMTASWVSVDPFNTLTGLVVKSDTGADDTYATTLAATTYFEEPFDGIVDGQLGHPYRDIRLHSGSFIINGRPSVQVTARWGWAAVPADVKQAAYIQAARILGRRESVHGVLGAGDFVVRVSNRLDPDVSEMLSAYRLDGWAVA